MAIYHVHHIIPRHLGGTDEPHNLTHPISIEDHSIYHHVLYRMFGKPEDKVAWLALSGQIGREEIIRETSSIGGKRSGNAAVRNKTGVHALTREEKSAAGKKGAAARLKKYPNLRFKQSEKALKNQKQALERINHQQGHRNSQYGSMWITNGVESIKIKKSDEIPTGWRAGRKMPTKQCGTG